MGTLTPRNETDPEIGMKQSTPSCDVSKMSIPQ